MSDECINLYPEQLRQIAAMCEALNASESAEEPSTGMGVQYTYGIPVTLEGGDGHVGRLVDEVGEWSFQPEPPSQDPAKKKLKPQVNSKMVDAALKVETNALGHPGAGEITPELRLLTQRMIQAALEAA